MKASEAILKAEDAIKGYLSVLQEDGDPLPREGKSVSVGLGRKKEAILRKVTLNLSTKTLCLCGGKANV